MQWAHNINYALKWVQPKAEKELKEAFELSMKVKDLSPESKQISEKYFLGELVRIHSIIPQNVKTTFSKILFS